VKLNIEQVKTIKPLKKTFFLI